jgi:hypothetical protein
MKGGKKWAWDFRDFSITLNKNIFKANPNQSFPNPGFSVWADGQASGVQWKGIAFSFHQTMVHLLELKFRP